MYDIFKKLCEEKGVSSAEVARATGVAKATLSEWKVECQQVFANFFKKIAKK